MRKGPSAQRIVAREVNESGLFVSCTRSVMGRLAAGGERNKGPPHWFTGGVCKPAAARTGWPAAGRRERRIYARPAGTARQPARLLVTHGCTFLSDLAVDAVHAVASPPRLLRPLAALDGVGLAAVPLYQHLAQQRLRLLRIADQQGEAERRSAGEAARLGARVDALPAAASGAHACAHACRRAAGGAAPQPGPALRGAAAGAPRLRAAPRARSPGTTAAARPTPQHPAWRAAAGGRRPA